MNKPKKIIDPEGGEIWRLCLYQNDERLITPLENGSISIWDTNTCERISNFGDYEDFVRTVRVSGDGVWAVSISGGPKTEICSIWNLGTTTPEHQADLSVAGFDLQILEDSTRFIVATREKHPVQIRELATGRLVGKIPSEAKEVYGLALVPGLNQVVLGCEGKLELWDLPTLTLVRTIEHSGPNHGVSVTSNGDRVIAGSHLKVSLWELKTGRLVSIFEGLPTLDANDQSTEYIDRDIFGFAVSPDDRLVFAGTYGLFEELGHVIAWDLETGEIVWRQEFKNDGVNGIVASTKRGEFYTAHDDGKLRVWDMPVSNTGFTARTTTRYCTAKAVLVGQSSSGKTCLGHALLDRKFSPQESTHGMEVWNLEAESIEQQDGEIVVRETMLWDLAGQVDYQVVHQLFLDETNLGLIVFDPSEPTNIFAGVGHWEKALARVAGEGCERLLIAGRTDRGYPAATQSDIEAFRLEHGFKGFIATSAKTGEGVAETKAAIRSAIPWEKLPIISTPKLWNLIRLYLKERKSSRYVLTSRRALRTAFRRRNKGVKFDKSDFDSVISIAQNQGLVWCFSFGDQVLMRPELLNNYAAAVVRAARKHPQGLGCVKERDILDSNFDFEDLKRISPKLEQKLLFAVVELFLQREIALRGGANNELIIFPSKFNRKLPDDPEPPLIDVAYRFSGSVEDIYATLVVRLFYSEAFKLKDLYQNTAEYFDVRNRICGVQLRSLNDGGGVLSTYFASDTSVESRVLFLRFIHEHLLHKSLAGTVKRERIYRCANTNCGEEVSDRKAIETRLKRGISSLTCQYCDQSVELIDELESEFGNNELNEKVRAMELGVAAKKREQVGNTVSEAKESIGEIDVFLAYNSADKLKVASIVRKLRSHSLNPWFDKEMVPPGHWFQDELQKAIRNLKSAAIIIGTEGLGRWQLVELRSLISQCVDQNIPVIPVLLPSVDVIPDEFLFLRELGCVKFEHTMDDPKAIEELIWGITGRQRKKHTS